MAGDTLPPDAILPYNTRYALQYREAMIRSSDIEGLIHTGFTNEAILMIGKAIGTNHEAERLFVDSAVNAVRNGTEKETLLEVTSLLAPGTEVDGRKLAQISRQGPRLWARMFAQFAEQTQAEGRELYLVGFSSMYGIGPVTEVFDGSDSRLNLLYPSWFYDDTDDCGITVQYGSDGIQVTFLPKDFPRPASNLVVDDTRNKGEKFEFVNGFWHQQPDAPTMTGTQLSSPNGQIV